MAAVKKKYDFYMTIFCFLIKNRNFIRKKSTVQGQVFDV